MVALKNSLEKEKRKSLVALASESQRNSSRIKSIKDRRAELQGSFQNRHSENFRNSKSMLPGETKSKFRIQCKREVLGGSLYSRSLLANLRGNQMHEVQENLKYLNDVDHLFFKDCKQFPPEIKDFHPKEKRGIWNAGGRCVYYVGLTNSYWFRNFRSGFTYEVVDYLGRHVLIARGSQWILGIKSEISVMLENGYLLGTMKQSLCGSNYFIKDGQGRTLYTIQAPCYIPAVPYLVWCFDEEFEICLDDEVTDIAKISRNWTEEIPEFDGDLGLEFEASENNRVKALLLGVTFLIEHQYYRHGGNGVAYFLITCAFIALSIFIFSGGFGMFNFIKNPFAGDKYEYT